MLNPLLQVPYREQDTLGLASCAVPLLAKTVGECLFLLRGLQLCQEQGVAYADLLGIERLDHWRGKLGQTDSLRLCCVVAYVASRVEGIVMVPFSHLKTT